MKEKSDIIFDAISGIDKDRVQSIELLKACSKCYDEGFYYGIYVCNKAKNHPTTKEILSLKDKMDNLGYKVNEEWLKQALEEAREKERVNNEQ